ncbi:MAG TPA: ATP-binding protein [Chlamydiales bacterium]|nr:ATP-binding protein [Chlamydiales bacterium]
MENVKRTQFNFEKADPLKPLADGFERLSNTMRNMAMLIVGSVFVRGLLATATEKFLESESLPVKINYVDWWPRTCQQVKNSTSKLWARRVEGATAATLASLGLVGAAMYSDVHPAAASVWNLAKQTTMACLKVFGFKDGLSLGDGLLTFWALPSIVGTGTSLALGSYDLARTYFDRDRVFEAKPIFNQTLQGDLDEILATACATKEDKGYFQNVLLYGPPGTGKTMVSKWIASNSKMNYIIMSGGDLLKTMSTNSTPTGSQAGAAVATLQKLIEHAKNLSSPTVVFIDEAEACFGRRDMPNKSQELISLLNAFLELTGQPTSKMMLILATNRPNDIDQAVRSRMDCKLYIGAPEVAERKNIIERNLPILISSSGDRLLFTKNIIDHIAKQTEGFSGRDIFKLINRLKAEIRQKRALSTANIDKVLERFVRQEHQIENQNNAENPLKANPFYTAAAGG